MDLFEHRREDADDRRPLTARVCRVRGGTTGVVIVEIHQNGPDCEDIESPSGQPERTGAGPAKGLRDDGPDGGP